MQICRLLVMCSLGIWCGCVNQPSNVNQPEPASVVEQTPSSAEETSAIGVPSDTAPAAEADAQPAANRADQTAQPSGDQPSPGVERVEAKAGVGVKGQRLEEETVNRTIAQPVRTLFAFEQRAELEFKMKHAIDLYKATNGTLPQTHEQFMSEIIEANQIKLPRLPPGERYVWDPKEGKLMVERPARN